MPHFLNFPSLILKRDAIKLFNFLFDKINSLKNFNAVFFSSLIQMFSIRLILNL